MLASKGMLGNDVAGNMELNCSNKAAKNCVKRYFMLLGQRFNNMKTAYTYGKHTRINENRFR